MCWLSTQIEESVGVLGKYKTNRSWHSQCLSIFLIFFVLFDLLSPTSSPQSTTPIISPASFCGTEQPNLWAEATKILKRGARVQVSSDLYIYFKDLQAHLPMADNHLWAQEAILSVVVVLVGSMPMRQHIGACQVSLSSEIMSSSDMTTHTHNVQPSSSHFGY